MAANLIAQVTVFSRRLTSDGGSQPAGLVLLSNRGFRLRTRPRRPLRSARLLTILLWTRLPR